MDKRGRDIAQNERLIILTALTRQKIRVGAARRNESVPSGIADPARDREEESLNSDDVNGVDPVRAIHVSRHQSAARKRSAYPKEVPLDRNDVHRVDADRTWEECGFCRSYGIVSANWEG